MLRGCWCDIIALNIDAIIDAKIADVKDSFCEE
jgi:hypothetical protein